MRRECWLYEGDVLSKHIDEAVRAEFTAPDARAPASRGEVNAASTLVFSWIRISEKKHDEHTAQLAVSSERLDLQSSRVDRLEQRLSAATKEIAALRRQLGDA